MAESSPKLLDLIPKEKEKMGMEEKRYGCSSDERKLELSLGLPGDINWSIKTNPKNCTSSVREREDSLLSLGYFTSKNNNGGVIGCRQEQNHHPWSSSSQQTTTSSSPFLQKHQKYQTCPKQHNGLPVMVKEPSQTCCTRIVDLQTAEKKTFSPPSVNTAVPNSSQKRAAPAPVVGWPPIRSFRKNLASSSGKAVSESQTEIPSKTVNQKPSEDNNTQKGLFVKINMDGVPIGRKVDLSAYNNYDSLSSSVDELFRGLLAAQRDSGGAIENKQEEHKPITDLLDGSGEYTLVYEDNEGDRMLVGDVPWHMFVSTVKRLRVLKSSDLMLSWGSSKESKKLVESSSK
ncbi:auxin-responsive protein IAA26-like [Amaranthus tricolor]|uniref:auxin-responsive protein IAA26-like n=1 Tax=Amaranthus tricolor TaxID=29722 RepID=UPI002585C8E2|nr:auxin-responsive protein IAA26-like [Amaranthus tricolor]XP_057519463.1 auxin-responsive protein IAA26-like [Amaranthus tricolor]